MEKFELIPGTINYAVSNYGNVINTKTGRSLEKQVSPTGYYTASISVNGKKKTLRVHRLVAMLFVPNTENKPYVNHIDGNKLNNKACNLEWCTAKENDTHARENGLKEQNKPITATEIETGETLTFASLSEAGVFLGISKGTICKVLKGERTSVHGFTFHYTIDR